ncbi:MAG: septum formation inhibitor Maf [Pseudonocardiales bacterium]|nr:Maf-like protein [Actinomycetota bacterium]PZS23141.1 MAG: septum formation inhibitor Maf [Pseudonocardiales bacterium]
MRLILASASPARLGVLRGAGIEPVVRVSGVDEDALTAKLTGATPVELVTALAAAKADAVATGIAAEHPDAVVVGCDSMLHIGGELAGKPGCADVALRRWQAMAGGTGELITGHTVVRLDRGVRTAAASGAQSTVIRFSTPTAEEIGAYVGTGEPLQVAGAFTLDGRGGWFVDGIDGDPSSVIGISLPLTRRLLAEVGVPVVSLWS